MRCRDGEFTMHCNLKIIAVLAILAVALTGAVAIVDNDANQSDADSPYNVYYVVGDITYSDISDGLVTLKSMSDLEAVVPEGKAFVGWTSGGHMYSQEEVLTISADTLYTAMFNVATYDVIFVANGVSMPFTDVTYGNEVFPSSDEESETYLDYSAAEGYEFIGWSNGTATITTIPAVTANVIYTAVYSAIVVPEVTYTVTFMVGEETTPFLVETVDAGDVAIEPAIDGYTWDFDFDTVISENTTINAVPIAEPSNEIFGMSVTAFAILLIVVLAMIAIIVVYAKKNGLFGVVKK